MAKPFYKEKEERKFYKPKPEERISEADTRVKIIDPQLWQSGRKEEDIKREFYFQKGKIIIEGNEAKRGEKKFADYLLFHNGDGVFSIAVIESKRYFKHHADGISEAKAEVGRARETANSIRLIASARPYHQTLKFTAQRLISFWS